MRIGKRKRFRVGDPAWTGFLQFSGFTSSLLNCGRWEGRLRELAARVNRFGLLAGEDAEAARVMLPAEWPHALVKIWALYEVS